MCGLSFIEPKGRIRERIPSPALVRYLIKESDMTVLRRKQIFIEAYKHDGSDERAFAIAQWINDHGGRATAFSRGDYEAYPGYAVVRIDDTKVVVNLIIPGSWAVNLGNNDYIGVPDNVIRLAYDILDESAVLDEVRNGVTRV